MGNINTYYGASDPIQGWVAPEFGKRIPNTVWGLETTTALPAWMGYILAPHMDDVAVHAFNGGTMCNINVQTNDMVYLITCHQDHVTFAYQSLK